MLSEQTNDIVDTETQDIWEEAERIRSLRPYNTDEVELNPWERDKTPEQRLTENVIKQAVEDIKTYVNSIVCFDSFDDWLHFTDPDRKQPISRVMRSERKDCVMLALKALYWVVSKGPTEYSLTTTSGHLSFHECVEGHTPGADVEYVREMVLNGPVQMIKEYPWIEDGLRWAKDSIKSESETKYRRYISL